MENFKKLLEMHNESINVINFPYSHCYIKNFLPIEYAKLIEEKFKFQEDVGNPDPVFQKTKRGLSDYNKFPEDIRILLNYLNSNMFVKILEKKFNLKNLLPDPTFFGGGMHESKTGGYLKIHSDFIYIRNRKVKRRLNLLLYLNENWNEKWDGALELWDQKMKKNFLKIYPNLNHCVIFRTDTESNHGFPDPIKCPADVTRKSLAVYYYTEDNSIFKRTKYYYARWKRRPGIDEPKFGDNRNIFERIKNNYLFRINY